MRSARYLGRRMAGQNVTRKLAAILAADVAGYSRLMGEDAGGTLVAPRQLRRELLEPLVSNHRGVVIKRMGDGWLIEFGSVVDAVTCAIEIQKDWRSTRPSNSGSAFTSVTSYTRTRTYTVTASTSPPVCRRWPLPEAS